MAKAMIRMHVLREFAALYERHMREFPFDSEEGREIHVPVKLLRMAHEIVEEQVKVKKDV